MVKLHEENRWRNIEPVEAEKQLGRLVQDQVEAVEKLLGDGASTVAFSAHNPEAILFLEVRKICGDRRLEEAFKAQALVAPLREKRCQLLELPNRSSRGDSFLYRLFLEDREGGRLEFRIRLDILQELKRKDPEQFLPFKQDEAALYCQLDQLDVGFGKFEELRQFRTNNRAQWFWFNERALIEVDADGKGVKVDGKVRSRKMTLEVIDALSGWSRIRGTNIRVKYQPYQFGELKQRQVFISPIRFTLNGLQATPEHMLESDMQEMGLS